MPATAVFLIVAVLDHLEVTISPEMVPAVALSLVEALAQVPDLRQARGIRHAVPAILLLGACAVLTGARSLAAMGRMPTTSAAASSTSSVSQHDILVQMPDRRSAPTGEGNTDCWWSHHQPW